MKSIVQTTLVLVATGLAAGGCCLSHPVSAESDAGDAPEAQADAAADIPNESATCETDAVGSIQVPVVALADQPVVLTLVHYGRACGATDGAATASVRGFDVTVSVQSCGGCEACGCRAAILATTIALHPLAAGVYTVSAGGVSVPLVVRDPAECFGDARAPLTVAIERPLADNPPDVLWVHAQFGQDCGCCEEQLGVRDSRTGDEIVLSALRCLGPPCDCAECGPIASDAWYPIRDAGSATSLVLNGTRVPLSP